MQYPFSCIPNVLGAIEATMSQARLGRYLPDAKGDKNLALRLYIWNARLCEEFYLPIQMTEVAVRNGIHRRLSTLYGDNWFAVTRFTDILPDRHKDEIASTVQTQRERRRATFAVDHVVAGLSFGFWQNLLGRNHAFVIWKKDAIYESFPHLPRTLGRDTLYKRVERLRQFRNSVMHHYAIYDKGPSREFSNIRDILGWACPESLWLMGELSNPATVLQRRPQF